VRILLANGRPGSWKAIQDLLKSDHTIKVVGEVASFSALVRHIEKGCVDLVLLDWTLPGVPPQVMVDFLDKTCPHLRVLVIADHPEIAKAANNAGVDVFYGRRDPIEHLTSYLMAT